MNKRFEKILLKNTLAIASPAIAVFTLLLVLLLKYPVLEHVQPTQVLMDGNMEKSLESLIKKNKTIVSFEAKDLRYAGFSYVVDEEKKGEYYYVFDNSRMYLVLLETTGEEKWRGSYSIKGKLIKDPATASHVVLSLTENTSLDINMLDNYCCPYIISELDYPTTYIFLVYAIYVAPIIVCVLIMAYCLLVWLEPAIHPQSKQLARYGRPGKVIKELNRQLRRNLLYEGNNIFITDDYMVVSYPTKTSVIRLDMIKYMSRDVITRKPLLGGKRELYRLIISNDDTLYYEIDFTKKETREDVIDYASNIYTEFI